jgi:hypothetical protein
VLVLQDMYSTLILLIPLKTQTATEITEALIERCVGLFGSPEELVSDQGSAFTSELASRVLEALRTQRTLTFSHTARANGQNERSHRGIMASLRILTQAYAENWSRVLPWIQLTYNTTPRYGSSLSAYDVVFARHPRMPRSALLPPRAGVTGGATEDLLEVDMAQIATSLREAWSALRRANLEQAEWERELVPVSFNIGDQVLVLYNAGAKRRNKHYMATEGPCTVTKVDNNDYDVYNNATGNTKRVNWSVLHHVYVRKPGPRDGAGRVAVDAAQDKTSRALDAKAGAGVPGEAQATRQLRADKPRPATKTSRALDAKAGAGEPGEAQATRQLLRDEPRRKPTKTGPAKARPAVKTLRPDVVDVLGKRVPFSRRGLDEADSSSDDGTTTPTKPTGPRQATPATANPGLPVPLAISEDDYVIVDNGPSGLAIGRARTVGEELVDVHWFSCKDMSVPTPQRIWWPLWVGPDGLARASDLPPRGKTAEIYEIGRSRVIYAFEALDQGRLPPAAQAFLGRISNNR